MTNSSISQSDFHEGIPLLFRELCLREEETGLGHLREALTRTRSLVEAEGGEFEVTDAGVDEGIKIRLHGEEIRLSPNSEEEIGQGAVNLAQARFWRHPESFGPLGTWIEVLRTCVGLEAVYRKQG